MNLKRRIIAIVQFSVNNALFIQKIEWRNKKDLRIFLHINWLNEAYMIP